MRPVLIVSHGQPSDPEPAQAELAALARAVAALLPGRMVGSATLAESAALARETARLGAGGLVYPLFMAGGWFTRIQIPARLAEAGAVGWQVLEPLGCDPAIHALAAEIVREEGAGEVLLAAHGSFKSSVPSDVAYHVAGVIRIAAAVRVEAAFIDQTPQLAAASGFGAGAVCLPYFAAAGGHVSVDIPAALAEAGFQGRLLPAIGTDARVPAIIARAIMAEVPVCQTVCRYKS